MLKTFTARKLSEGFTCALLSLLLTAALAVMLIGCGGSGALPPGSPMPGASTNVNLLLTSTANDQLSRFVVGINSVVLQDMAGNRVTLYNSNAGPQPGEFMHLNGASEPLVTVSVPQAVYSSATVAASGCFFTAVRFASPGPGQPNTLITSTYAEGSCGQGTGTTTVNLPSPITISGSTKTLSLNLQVSQSFTLGGIGADATYTISPVFTLSALAISAPPTNELNGMLTGIDAQISSLDTTHITIAIQTADQASLQINSNSSTTFQGIAGFDALAAGMLVNLDAAIQSDGSLLATRIEMGASPGAGAFFGPWLTPSNNPDVFVILPFTCFLRPDNPACDVVVVLNSNTTFNVSGQFSNLANLPFNPSFDSSSIFMGQNVANYSIGARDAQGEPPITSVTLAPQTINGTVASVSNMNGFSVYSVNLAPYDLIPTVQLYLSPLPANLTNPGTVVVYADSSTQLLTSGIIGQGSLARFRGVIFNDKGVARMDCQEILDGVSE